MAWQNEPGNGGWGDEVRVLGREFLGTFALTFVAASAVVINAITGQVSYAARVGAPGLLIMGMIYALGEISGAHLNPAVTLAFSVRGVFSWKRVPGYIAFQLAGAVLAALLILNLFGDESDLGATIPHRGEGTSLVMEAILTLFLVMVVIGTATGHRIVGHNAGLAVGGTVALCGLFAEPISGASMNPARSLGPALISGKLESIWIYIIGPLAVGAASRRYNAHAARPTDSQGRGSRRRRYRRLIDEQIDQLELLHVDEPHVG
ncbi:MAG: aquaporin [Actinobacteria bacterium]|nr:aquaporin [Actinomycetota bacterium]